MNLPEGISMPQIVFNEKKDNTSLSKISVPSQAQFSWTFNLASTSTPTLQWDASLFQTSNKKLMLVDIGEGVAIDMTQQSSYQSPSKQFEIHFGDAEYIKTKLDTELPLIGNPYPNPAQSTVTFPVHIADTLEGVLVTAVVYDVTGRKASEFSSNVLTKGDYSLEWRHTLSAGIYLMTMMSTSGERKTVKLVIN
jgi:hypothetical protein